MSPTRRRGRPASSRAEWTVGNAQTAMFDTGAADQGALFGRDHAGRPNDHRACVTCGSETAGGDRCPRCVGLGATALELIDESE